MDKKLELTILALSAIGALFAFIRGQQVKIQENIIAIETEFRCLMPTFLMIEDPYLYVNHLQAALKEARGGPRTKPLKDEEVRAINRIDRALRFLYFLKTNCDHFTEGLALMPKNDAERAFVKPYYHYLFMVVSPERPELQAYVKSLYKHTNKWIEELRERHEHEFLTKLDPLPSVTTAPTP